MERRALIRTNIYLTARQHAALAKEAKRLNISSAELLRRVIDGWLEEKLENRKDSPKN